ncbi:MAG: tetratricopeptide repeat protein, partial [Magnetococcales bacterium]|nr:tetratricopeptide repeat protein [Magnetococcales bacterium]
MDPHPPATDSLSLEWRLAEAGRCAQQGEQERGLALYESVLASCPEQVEALHGASLICLGRNDFAATVAYLERALRVQPEHPVLSFNSGLALIGQGDLTKALERFKAVIGLQPDHARAYCYAAQILIQHKNLTEAAILLQKAVDAVPNHAESHALLAVVLQQMDIKPVAHYHQRMAWFLAKNGPDLEKLPPQHTLFLDRERAMRVALQANMVPETIHASGLQLCYHMGDPFPEAPANLICVPMDREPLHAFFFASKLSQPTVVDFDPEKKAQLFLAGRLANLLHTVRLARSREIRRLEQLCQATRPEFIPGQPLRIYLPSSRKTDVMMNNLRDLSQGFKPLHCEILHYIESNNRENFYFDHYYQAQVTFNPHVLVDINGYFHLNGHPDIFRVLWFTDPMPSIMAGKPLPWRKRDLIYSLDKELDVFLERCGAVDIQRQGFCYNAQLF